MNNYITVIGIACGAYSSCALFSNAKVMEDRYLRLTVIGIGWEFVVLTAGIAFRQWGGEQGIPIMLGVFTPVALMFSFLREKKTDYLSVILKVAFPVTIISAIVILVGG